MNTPKRKHDVLNVPHKQRIDEAMREIKQIATASFLTPSEARVAMRRKLRELVSDCIAISHLASPTASPTAGVSTMPRRLMQAEFDYITDASEHAYHLHKQTGHAYHLHRPLFSSAIRVARSSHIPITCGQGILYCDISWMFKSESESKPAS